MTDAEVQLLNNLRKVGVWDMKGGSFTVHFDAEGIVAKIDVQRFFKITKKLSTAQDVRQLTDSPA